MIFKNGKFFNINDFILLFDKHFINKIIIVIHKFFFKIF